MGPYGITHSTHGNPKENCQRNTELRKFEKRATFILLSPLLTEVTRRIPQGIGISQPIPAKICLIENGFLCSKSSKPHDPEAHDLEAAPINTQLVDRSCTLRGSYLFAVESPFSIPPCLLFGSPSAMPALFLQHVWSPFQSAMHTATWLTIKNRFSPSCNNIAIDATARRHRNLEFALTAVVHCCVGATPVTLPLSPVIRQKATCSLFCLRNLKLGCHPMAPT